jgi:hypothetical protein
MRTGLLMDEYNWYSEITSSDEITQGDLIENCRIIAPNIEAYDEIMKDDNEDEEAEMDLDIIDLETVVVLSQACDLSNDKIDSVVLCKVWSLRNLILADTFYESSKARENLRQGKQPSYHLLNSYESEEKHMDLSIVDFRRIYTAPKEYLKKVAIKCKTRLRILPPYREHLSQAFARYFMRVGLPSDIEKDKVKNFKV